MGALIGLGVGIGVVLIVSALVNPRTARSRITIETWLRRAGVVDVPTGQFISASAALGVVVSALTVIVTALPIVALLAGLAAAISPAAVVRRRAVRRLQARQSAWPDAVDSLVSAVRAGLSLPEAVMDLAHRGPAALRPHISAFTSEYRASGSFDAALKRLARDLADPVGDRVISALVIAWRVGGTELGSMLRSLSAMVREDLRTRGDIEARQSWTINAARVSVAAPWITLALLSTRPEALAAYRTLAGTLVIAGAALISVIAYRLMLRIAHLPMEERAA